jgi:hypothetical protein
MAASSAAAWKEGNLLAGIPKNTSVESIKEKFSPNKWVSRAAAEDETTLCPLVCSGKGGVSKTGRQSWSIC